MLLFGRLLDDPAVVPQLGWLRIGDGRIVERGDGEPKGLGEGLAAGAGTAEQSIRGGRDRLISPGFIDAHLHAPQLAGIGCDGMPLLEWLEQVIFPLELCWSDQAVVASEFQRFHARLLASGTTGAAAFSSPHRAAMETLLRRAGCPALRLEIGQALMDRGGPDGLIGEPAWHPRAGLEDPRLRASINPRFAVSCSGPLLRDAARLAGSDRLIHTHLAESQTECRLVRELFPACDSYAEVYDRHGLLGPRTLLAHALHLSPPEWSMIAARGSAVVHCPQANAFLRSGIFDLRAAREHGVRVALGSDIAAGCDLAMPRVARSMIESAKLRAAAIDARAVVPSPAEAWRMITQGNAATLGWHDHGTLLPGAAADLLLLRPDVEFDRHLPGRLLYGWHDEWIEGAVVNGSWFGQR